MNSIMTSILGIILFLIISQETVYRFGISTLNMNIAEAEFLAGEYQIYKKHLLFIIIITLIQSIVNYFTTESDCIDTNDSNYNASKQIYYHEINEKTCSDGKSYIICPSCGIEQPSNYKECWNCNFKFSGTKAMKDSISKCPNCGAVITEEMLFCGNCGNKLKEQ